MVGQLLIAPPAQTDDYWGKSVILMYEQTAQASLGLILNKQSDRSFAELAEHHGHSYSGNEMIYVGGPVNPSALVMLHTDDWSCTNTMQISGTNLRISSDRTMLKRLCAGDRPKLWRLFLGMSAWTQSQLEGEMLGKHPWSKKTAWVTSPSNPSIVFDVNPERMWKRSIDLAAQVMVDSYFTIS
jgi:putative transcriptional regulator